jgi:heptosyltransferase-2
MVQEPIIKPKIKRILIRATNWVGDAVMTIPALEAVKENFPKASLTVLARPWVIPVFETHPAVDQVIPYSKGLGYYEDLLEFIRIIGILRRSRYDMTILFQNAFEAALLTYLGGIKIRVGYNTDGRGFLLSHPVHRHKKVLKCHQVEYYLSILRGMGWEAKSKDPEIFVAENDRATITRKLLSNGVGEGDFLLGLSPGAVYGPAKRWPADRFAIIGDRAVEQWGAKVVILGSQKEQDICTGVSQAMKHPALNLCGKTTLGEGMALINRCVFFITNDSGLMHVAAALNVPLLVIFGSTDPVATGPRSQFVKVVRNPVYCAPCLKPKCSIGYPCLMKIGPDDVWIEMERLRESWDLLATYEQRRRRDTLEKTCRFS